MSEIEPARGLVVGCSGFAVFELQPAVGSRGLGAWRT